MELYTNDSSYLKTRKPLPIIHKPTKTVLINHNNFRMSQPVTELTGNQGAAREDRIRERFLERIAAGENRDDELYLLLNEALDLNVTATFYCKHLPYSNGEVGVNVGDVSGENDAQPGFDIEMIIYQHQMIMRYSKAANCLIKVAMEQLARKEPMSQQQREEPSTQDEEMDVANEGLEEFPPDLLEEWETQEESYTYYMMTRVRVTLQPTQPSVTPH